MLLFYSDHFVSLLCINVYDVSSYYDTLFSILTPYVNFTVLNLLIVQFHDILRSYFFFLFIIYTAMIYFIRP